MSHLTRRISTLVAVVVLPVIAVLVTWTIINSPGAPPLDQQDPVRITLADSAEPAAPRADGSDPGANGSGPNATGGAPHAVEPEQTPSGPVMSVEFQPAPPRPVPPPVDYSNRSSANSGGGGGGGGGSRTYDYDDDDDDDDD